MVERNETRYQLEQDNKTYILTTSLINDKLKLKCQDTNSQIFVGTFNMNDLLRLSRYFSSTNNVEQVQLYLNGIIEKQRIGIFPKENIITIVLYLINQDKIYIPLTLNINDFYNNSNQYFQNQQENIFMDSTNYSETQILDNLSPTYLYNQNDKQIIYNKYNSLPYYTEQNISKISNISGIGASSFIPEFTNVTFENQELQNMNLSPNKNELVSIQNVSLFPQSDISNNDYNFQIEENKIDKLEDDTNIIKIEQEKIKNEMKRVLDEASKLKQENEIFKTENASLSNENKALQDENEKYKEQIINYENEIKIYKDENESYRRQLNDSIYKTKNNELLKIKETYENEIQLLRENFEKLNKENESLKEEIEELKNNYTAVTNENESLVNDINNLKANITNHQKDILNEDEIKRLIEENSVFRIKAQENESLKKQIEEYKVKLKEQNEEREEEEDSQEFIEKNEVIGDIIHNKNELDMITNKINKENKKIIINLLYKATADSDKASVFHEKCDKAKNSIVLVETENGMRFGGYTTCSWSGNCVDKIDPEAFIFSFDKMKTYDNIPGDEAIGCYPKFGPIFLGCQIKIFDNFFIKGGTTFERELNFNTEEDYELTGGDREFKVKDIEVYEVLFE
jgi:hypothetical protein